MARSKPIEVWVQMAALAIVISAGSWYTTQPVSTSLSSVALPAASDEEPASAVTIPLPIREGRLDEMQVYTSQQQSFSILVPVEVGWVGHYMPMQVYEDLANGVTHIVPVKDLLFFSDSNQEVEITSENAAESEYGWHITIADARNQTELLSAIRKGFGPRCAISAMRLNDNGLYDIQLNDTGVDSPDCSQPGVTFIKYDARRGKVAYWETGNGTSLAKITDKEDIRFRNVAAASFRFVGKVMNTNSFWHPDATVVWIPDINKLYAACPAPDTVCEKIFMKLSGAPAPAIDFFDATGWYATAFRSFGPVALIDVVNPWRANGNDDYLIADAAGELFIVEGRPVGTGALFDDQEIWDGLQEKLPKFSMWVADEFFVRGSSDRLIFQFDIKDERGCHACSSGYAARVGFNFDVDGRFIGSTLIGICAGDEAANNKDFPICSLVY